MNKNNDSKVTGCHGLVCRHFNQLDFTIVGWLLFKHHQMWRLQKFLPICYLLVTV